MPPTESSVVVALREVRRLESERQRKEEEARLLQHEEEARLRRQSQPPRTTAYYGAHTGPVAAAGPVDPYAGGYGNGPAPGYPVHPYDMQRPLRHTAEVGPEDGGGAAFGQSGPYAQSGPYGVGYQHPVAGSVWANAAPMHGPMAEALPEARPRTSWTGVFITILLLGGAGAAGYWKLTQDFQAQIRGLDIERRRVEDARNLAVEGRVKAEQDAKLKMLTLETKIASLEARASAAKASAVVEVDSTEKAAPAAPVAAPEPKKARGAAKGRLGKRTVAKAERPAAVRPRQEDRPAPKGDDRKVARKKTITDDPLGGL